MATSAEQAFEIAKSLGGLPVVVKAQIHAGGRGKGGGVKVCQTLNEAKTRAKEILGMMLRTHQTGPEGQEVKRLLVEEGVAIEKELYAGLVLDRAQKRVVLMMSAEGGMDIEEVAAKTPEKIHKAPVDPGIGLMPYQVRQLWFAMGLPPKLVGRAVKMCMSLYKAYTETDASLLEINPLIITKDGDLLALDAKMNFDDNALFRHQDIQEYRDLDEEDPKEVRAKNHDLSYIALDGNVGCMVNGAGLAMSTMDIIKHCGGEPANFLDVGGVATVGEGHGGLSDHPLGPEQSKAVLVNIFGGIMKCDVIARASSGPPRSVEARRCRSWCGSRAPTSSSARKMLSGVRPGISPSRPRSDMDDAAQKVVAPRRKAEERPMSNLRRQRHAGPRAGHHGRRTARSTASRCDGVRHAHRGRRHARRRAGSSASTDTRCRSSTPCRSSPREDRRQRHRDLRAGRSFAADAIIEAVDAGAAADRRRSPRASRSSTWSRVAGSMEGTSCAPDRSRTAPASSRPASARSGSCPGTSIVEAGNIGVVSRSGTLTYEAVGQLTTLGIGQSTCVGIGGDPVNGTNFVDTLEAFNRDPDTHGVIMIGEIGGTAEETAAEYVKAEMKKPVAGFVAGTTAPPGKRMGHAGAIISGGKGTAAEKIAAMTEAGILVAPTPAELATTLQKAMEAAK